jgi:hypothetical protein
MSGKHGIPDGEDSRVKAILDMMDPGYAPDPRQKNIVSKVEEALQLSEHFMKLAAEKNNTWTTKDVDLDKRMVFRNQMVAKCFNDLIPILEFIDPDTFNSHVNSMKNDIADWIEATFDKKEISRKIRVSKDKDEMISILKSTA